jgi:hypothetical protein
VSASGASSVSQPLHRNQRFNFLEFRISSHHAASLALRQSNSEGIGVEDGMEPTSSVALRCQFTTQEQAFTGPGANAMSFCQKPQLKRARAAWPNPPQSLLKAMNLYPRLARVSTKRGFSAESPIHGSVSRRPPNVKASRAPILLVGWSVFLGAIW